MSSHALSSELVRIETRQTPYGNRFILYADDLQPILGTSPLRPGGSYSFTSADPSNREMLQLYFPNGSPFGTEDLLKIPINHTLTVVNGASGKYPFTLKAKGGEVQLNIAVADKGVAEGEVRMSPGGKWCSCIRIDRRFSKIFIDNRGLPGYKITIINQRSGKRIHVYPWRCGYFAFVPRGAYRIIPEPKLLDEKEAVFRPLQTGGTDEADIFIIPGRASSRIIPFRQTRPRFPELLFAGTCSNRVQCCGHRVQDDSI